MKTIFTKQSRQTIFLTTAMATATVAICLSGADVGAQSTDGSAPSSKRQTSDPYFSSVKQAAAAVQKLSAPVIDQHAFKADSTISWEHPTGPQATEETISETGTDVWNSLSRKITKPVQRIDFSQLKVDKAVQEDITKTASAWAVPKTEVKTQAKPTPHLGQLKPLIASSITTSDISPSAALKTDSIETGPIKANPLMPLAATPSTPPAKSPIDFEARPLKPTAAPLETEVDSSVQQATFTQPVDEPFVPGQNLKKIGSRIKDLSAAPAKAIQGGPQHRVADSRTGYQNAGSPTYPQPIYDSSQIVNSTPTYNSSQTYAGKSFELTKVMALVAGDPIFVGDMIFEVNQLLEKHMKGAPEEAKEMQRGKLLKRLLPKYVDQKMLYIATTNQLPEEADMEDVIKQAEKTFNEKALPDIMEKSGVPSVTQFDANLRAQGSSIRQMRRAWAKDQVSRYFLSEQVNFSRDVTPYDLLQEYRGNYDSYAKNAKCRWEQIKINFDKSGGRFAAKDKAEDIYNRLVHGGNFQAIAKKESHGFKASSGGQHDWINKGSLVNKKIDELIFTMPTGRLSEIIETKDAWHIIRVVERINAHHTPFVEAQGAIKDRIIDKRRDEAFKKYLTNLRKEIPVEYPEG